MWNYPVNQHDKIRRAYLKDGTNRFITIIHFLDQKVTLIAFKPFGSNNFLGLSILVLRMLHIVYHIIYLLRKEMDVLDGMYLLPRDLEIGERVHEEKNCAFLTHIGEDPCSPHNNVVKSYEDLQNQSRHIDKVLNA